MRIYVWIVIFYDVFERLGFCEDEIVVVVVLFCRVVISLCVFGRWEFLWGCSQCRCCQCCRLTSIGCLCLCYYLRGCLLRFLWGWSQYHCRWCRRDYWERCHSLWIFWSVLLLRFLWKWNRCRCRWCHRFVSLGCLRLCLCWYLRGC